MDSQKKVPAISQETKKSKVEWVNTKERLEGTYFYLFNQCNSGGSFIKNDYLGEYVIIEAHDAQHANMRATGIGIYFNGCDSGQDCDCCGDRWNQVWGNDKGFDEPGIVQSGDAFDFWDSENGRMFGSYQSTIIVHFLDGRIAKITKEQ